MFAQVSTSTDTNSTTVTKDHGKKSKSDTVSTSSTYDPAGTTTDSSHVKSKTKKHHGKEVTKSKTTTDSSATPQ